MHGPHRPGDQVATTVTILASRQGWHTDQLCRALTVRGASSRIVPWEGIVSHLGPRETTPSLRSGDAVLARIIPNGSLEQIIYRVDALHWLEDVGIRVINSPRAIERSVDKFYTSALLERAGLRTPETVVCERLDDAMAAFRQMRDVIVKPLFGSMGLGLVRVSNEDVAWRTFRAIEHVRGVFYLQRFIDHDGRDLRAFVVGDRVLGAIERLSPTWRTNVSRGGAARPYTLSAHENAMALTAARAVGAAYAGVDLLPGNDGHVYALEVNGIPGWRGLHEATGLDVAGAIVDLALR